MYEDNPDLMAHSVLGRIEGTLKAWMDQNEALDCVREILRDWEHYKFSVRSKGLYPFERSDGCVCPACKAYKDFESDVANPNLEAEVTR